jgi:DNA-binding NtrC family response regulator
MTRGLPFELRVEILLICREEGDYTRLSHILSRSRWTLRRVASLAEALASLATDPVGIVIAEAGMPDGTWKDLLTGVAGLRCPPNIIVSSRLADELLWAEVLNLGGYDVLVTPFEAEEVFRVGSAAWLEWRWRMKKAGMPVRKAREGSASGPPLGRLLAAASSF